VPNHGAIGSFSAIARRRLPPGVLMPKPKADADRQFGMPLDFAPTASPTTLASALGACR